MRFLFSVNYMVKILKFLFYRKSYILFILTPVCAALKVSWRNYHSLVWDRLLHKEADTDNRIMSPLTWPIHYAWSFICPAYLGDFQQRKNSLTVVSVEAPGGTGRESSLDSFRAAATNLLDLMDHRLATAAVENSRKMYWWSKPAYLTNFSTGGYNPKKALIVSQKRKFRER